MTEWITYLLLVCFYFRVKEIQSVYIDTTFCVPQAMFIPSREDTTNAAVDLIADWLSRSRGDHIIRLQYRADLGYENLFVRFSLEFNMKVSAVIFLALLTCVISVQGIVELFIIIAFYSSL